jgi:hypothetical protein
MRCRANGYLIWTETEHSYTADSHPFTPSNSLMYLLTRQKAPFLLCNPTAYHVDQMNGKERGRHPDTFPWTALLFSYLAIESENVHHPVFIDLRGFKFTKPNLTQSLLLHLSPNVQQQHYSCYFTLKTKLAG